MDTGIRAQRLQAYLAEKKERLLSKEAQMFQSVLSGFDEADTHQTPSPVRRCVASIINKGGSGTKDHDDVSKKKKSKAFAVCWAQHNKGRLSKGFGGKEGKMRKGQYKALLKNK